MMVCGFVDVQSHDAVEIEIEFLSNALKSTDQTEREGERQR